MCIYVYMYKYIYTYVHIYICIHFKQKLGFLFWKVFVGSLKLYVSFAKEPYKRDYILQKRPIILRSLLMCVYTNRRFLFWKAY